MSTMGRCKQCQKFFEGITNRTKFCSDICSNKYHYNKRKNPLIKKKCLKCEKEFKTYRNAQKFCNILCKNIYHKQGIIKIKVCPFCNKVFECTNNSQIYCSNECYKETKLIRDKEYYKRSKK